MSSQDEQGRGGFATALLHTEAAYNAAETAIAQHRREVIQRGNDPDTDPEHQRLIELTAPLRRWLINATELADKEN